jgi:8-oxo-dGTP pyrophosphatase MutT (NUDIX family)
MKSENLAEPVVCIIIEREDRNGERKFLIQTRWKPKTDPRYTGVYEIPGGKIRANETLEQAVRREALEETGMEVEIKAESFKKSYPYTINRTESYAFHPLVCSQEIGDHPYIGFFVVCKRKKTVTSLKGHEAVQQRWVTRNELLELIHKKKILPINAPGLSEYLSYIDVGHKLR